MPAKKKPHVTTRASTPRALSPLVAELRGLILSARHQAASTINTLQVLTNFEIGRRIVEHEQKGAKRAGYGKELLKELSSQLRGEFGKGFSVSNLQLMRKFFIENQIRIQQQPTVKLASVQILQQPAEKLGIGAKNQQPVGESQISQQPNGKSGPIEIWQHPTAKSVAPFTLSWTHYVLLLTIKDPDERSFYEIEATSEG